MKILISLLAFFSFSIQNFSQIINFTGNTQSYLEPCGCVDGMLGGIARRGTLLKTIPKGILVDSGNFTDIENDLDLLRNDYYVRSYNINSYNLLAVGDKEIEQTAKYLKSLKIFNKLLSSNVVFNDKTNKFMTSKLVDGVTFIALTSATKKVNKDFKVLEVLEIAKKYKSTKNLVLLSSLNSDDLKKVINVLKSNLKLVIANYSSGDFENIEGVAVVYSGEKGKLIKSYDLSNKSLNMHEVKESLKEEAKNKEIIDAFFKEVSQNSNLQKMVKRHFEDKKLEQQVLQGKNKFVGSENCKTCHVAEFNQWKTTKHASSMDILFKKKRDFVPDCVSCHTTGFSYESGYSIAKREKWNQAVGCESCHGPGLNHFQNPTQNNIRAKMAKSDCMSCHDPENSPFFDFKSYHSQIKHDNIIKTVAKPKVIKKSKKVDIDLYVMSQCPFGIKAENKMFPLVKKYKDLINFNLRFIATDVQDKLNPVKKVEDKKSVKVPKEEEKSGAPGCKADFDLDPNAKFQSLHGKSEVDENIVQILVNEFYPDKMMDFILARNKNIYKNWKLVANQFGMDSEKISNALTNGIGDKLFRKNIKFGNDLGISASPTIKINGQSFTKPFHEVPLTYEICSSLENPSDDCLDVPICSMDNHCVAPGKNGFCINPNKKEAYCEFKEPIAVSMLVIRDDSCDICNTGALLKQMHSIFPKLSVKSVNKDADGMKALVKKLGIDRYPVFLFSDDKFLKSPKVKFIQRLLAFKEGKYFLNPLVNEIASLDREEKLGTLKLYMESFSRGSNLQIDLIKTINALEKQNDIKLDYQFVPKISQSRDGSALKGIMDQRFEVVVTNPRGKSFPLMIESREGRKEIVEGVNQLCIQNNMSTKEYRDYLSSFSSQMFQWYSNKNKKNIRSEMAKFDASNFRTKAFKDASINKLSQVKIAKCVGSQEGAQYLIGSLTEGTKIKIVASPTLLINNKIILRNVNKKILEVLPDLLLGKSLR
ncbi:MAG: hypothetical protein COB02_14850 [Candidatus Cloacimonadota bacterium]|nr:MAG: hypothetical protein COB02_14850 [Candidatus Cloacimonadota bacterium]